MAMPAPLDEDIVDDLIDSRQALPAIRVFGKAHRKTPTGVGSGDSRFTSVGAPYKVLYCAESFETAYIEGVVRDQHRRPSGPLKLPVQAVTEFCYSQLYLQEPNRLNLLDLKKSGAFQLGVPTDAVHARNHAAGRSLGARIYHHHRAAIDGIVFSSRFTGKEVYAIFDWALSKISGEPAARIADHPDLADILKRYNIELIDQ